MPSPVWTATAVPSAVSDGWKTFRSEQGGYAVDYPATWKVEERIGAEGALMTTFVPPNGTGITLVVQFSKPTGEDNSDMMNVHCEAVMVGGVPAKACFDTISFSLTTTMMNQGKTYSIITSRKGGDQRIYDRVLASFRLIP